MTTANLSLFSPSPPPATAPSRSTTYAQLSTEDIPASPDDDDELERRLKLKLTYQNSPPTLHSSTPVKRLCLWQNHIAQSTDDEPQQANSLNKSSTSTISRLTNLNLSHNRFETLPPMLCCLVPYLTSLNLSHNLLTDPSYIACYPPRLKTLDLSCNRLQQSILAEAKKEKGHRRHRHHEPSSDLSVCFRPELKETNNAMDANKRRRSRSVSRHKVLASTSLSIGSNASNKAEGADQVCTHRRHTKLEFLHDLNLSDNTIKDLILVVSYLSEWIPIDLFCFPVHTRDRHGYATFVSAVSSCDTS